jgi:Fe-S-cluster containining protein
MKNKAMLKDIMISINKDMTEKVYSIKKVRCGDCIEPGCCYAQRRIEISTKEASVIEDFIEEKHIQRWIKSEDESPYGKEIHRCPFLNDDGKCDIYDVRPFACSAYCVTSDPKDCLMSSENKGVYYVNPESLISGDNKLIQKFLLISPIEKSDIMDLFDLFKKRIKND